MDSHAGTARLFKAFCDESRLAILERLADGEKCACVLLPALGISQSTLSHHMRILCDSGIVKCRTSGKWSHYSLSDEGFGRARKVLDGFRAPTAALQAEEICACD